MKSRSQLVLLLILMSSILSGCDDDSDSTPSPIRNPTVLSSGYYKAADAKMKPCYWVDLRRTDLSVSDQGRAQAVAVSGQDVYTAGDTFTAGPADSKACYWKNATRMELDGLTNTHARATDIYVSGGIVHVVGVIPSTPGDIFYWNDKSKTPVLLGKDIDWFQPNLLASGGKLYITGNNAGNDASHPFAAPGSTAYAGTYWTLTVAADTGAASIVQGADLGVAQESYPGAVAVDEGNVYLAGAYDSGSNSYQPCYWKNGTRQAINIPAAILQTNPSRAIARGINVSAGRLIVTGQIQTTTGMQVFVYLDENLTDATAGTLTVLSDYKLSDDLTTYYLRSFLYNRNPILSGGFTNSSGTKLAGSWTGGQFTQLPVPSDATEAYATKLIVY